MKGMRKGLIAVALAALAAVPTGARAEEEQRLPVPEPGVVGKLAAITPCTSESEYDVPSYYGDDCRRLRIVFGPIVVNPGKNDVLIQPVTFEKPMWDGYMVRFKPGLFDATGKAPPVEQLHLHHGTWLNAGRAYGSGPWLATGEEKTVVAMPNRYGLKIQGSDTWLFLHMVHSAVANPTVVWASYDIDFVEASVAETRQPDNRPLITNTKGIWLDVGGGGAWSDGRSNDDQFPFNPVYNVQKGFGNQGDVEDNYSVSPADAAAYGLDSTELDVCAWPADNCARENSSGRVSRNQGNDVSEAVDGWDWRVSPSFAGTLVVMGGHLHMGGVNDTVSLTREFTAPDGSKKRFEKVIHVSDAYYWNWQDPSKVGAPPISWDVSLSGVSADMGWKVNIKEGDTIRLNADYETSIASWYENMGIVMTWVAPGEFSGVDPFAGCQWTGGSELTGCDVTIHSGRLAPRQWDENGPRPLTPSEVYNPDGTLVAPGVVSQPEVAPGYEFPGAHLGTCTPSATVLCTRGQITHGHIETSGNHRGCLGMSCGDALLASAPDWIGDPITEITMGGFAYAPGDFGQIAVTGIPEVKLGSTIRFTNQDQYAVIPHTATACKYPCTGPVNTHYPIPDAGAKVVATPDTTDDPSFTVLDPNGDASLDLMDFDTTQLGINLGAPGVGFGLLDGGIRQPEYQLKATRTGVYTYFCRIHPFMRGAFEVVA
jgi:hypothetical protein